MNKKLISVIVPVYKVPETFLRKCIESIINQTFKNIEIILVDDGSPDNCGKICDEYAIIDNRIKVVHQINKGLCGARNTGIKNATCEWITFVDGDDWIEKNLCQILYDSIDDNIDVICSGYVKEYENNKIIRYDNSKYFEDGKIYKKPNELKYMKMMCLNFTSYISSSCAKLIRKELLQSENILFDEKLMQGAEGIEFCFRLFNKARKIKVIYQYLYHYLYNDQSITTIPSEKNAYMILGCFEKIKHNIDKNDTELLYWYYNRLIYVIVTTTISMYFNPTSKEKTTIRIKKYKKYLENEIVEETLRNTKNIKIDSKRKVVLFCIKRRLYIVLILLGILKNIRK